MLLSVITAYINFEFRLLKHLLACSEFRCSNFLIGAKGVIYSKKDKQIIPNFKPGPYRTILGPDNRPVSNARVSSNNLSVELLF